MTGKKSKPRRRKKTILGRISFFSRAEGGKWHSGRIWESSKWKSKGSAFDVDKILEEKTAFHSTRFSAAMFVSHTAEVVPVIDLYSMGGKEKYRKKMPHV